MSSGSGFKRRRDQDKYDSESEDEMIAAGPNISLVEKLPESDSVVSHEVVEKVAEEAAEEAADKPASKKQSHDDIEQLRQLSRQKYLNRQEKRKLAILRKDLEFLEQDVNEYGWDKLSEKEQNEIKLKRSLVQIIQEKNKGYFTMQDDYIKDGKIDTQRKAEILNANVARDEKGVNWEQQQMQNVAKGVEEYRDEYEYVFDDNIEFVSDNVEPIKSHIEELIDKEEKRQKTMDETRRSLPVYQYRQQLLDAIKEHQVMIIVGETGSGKTTQLPQYLVEDGYTQGGKLMVACTQPRRVAAMSVATRVADEMGTKLGDKVGYSMRFEDETSENTVLKYMTDGMLLREFMTDPELSRYAALMIDEAHERTLSTDVLFGLIKGVIAKRPDMKLLIASATMNASKFSKYFGDAPIFNIPGRMYPVDIHYTTQPEANYIHAAITTVFQIHTTQPKGDILVFLTGQDEIETMAENLEETCSKLGKSIKEMLICPIYANLPSEMQQKIFEPTPENARKVVLATNIAETSITIDGVVYVIDPGFVKENTYNPTTGMESLVVVPCSRASADQRAGRAGRVGPGKCFRLFTKWAYFNELPGNPTPEILRTNLVSVVLLLLSMGIKDLIHFDFMDRPNATALIKSLELLYALGAMNSKGQLTQLGITMSEFPADPMLAKTLITSAQFGVMEETLSVVAMISESQALFFRPKDKKQQVDSAIQGFNKGSDHLTLLEIWSQWEATGFSYQWCQDNFLQPKTLKRIRNVRAQLARLCKKFVGNVEVQEPENRDLAIYKSFVSGFFPNAVKLAVGGGYKSIKKNISVYIHPSSMLFDVKPPHKYLLYNELMLTSKEYMRNIMPIEEKWLKELAPHYFKDNDFELKKKTN